MTLNPSAVETTVKRKVDFAGWFERNNSALYSLFRCYGVTNELKSDEQTIKFSVYRLLRNDDNKFDFSESKVNHRVLSLYRLVRGQFSKREVRDVFSRIRENSDKLGVLRFVSAKDYVFPSLYGSIKGKYHLNISRVAFSVLIAECIVELSDPYFGRRLRQVCR